MIKNYLLLAIRNMRKGKLHTFINIGGMTVAFACSVFILLMVYRHFSFDNFQKNKDSLYKVYEYSIGPNGEEQGTSMAFPLTPALKAENIGVERATSIYNRGKLVRYKDKTLDMNTTLVDEDFLKMFTCPVVKGNPVNPLSSTGSAVLTQTSASKLFGTEDPVGKKIETKMNGKWYGLIVSAVVKDMPANSSIRFSLLARTELNPDFATEHDNWNNQSHPVYVQLAKNTTQKQVENRLRAFVKKYIPADVPALKKDGYHPDKNGDYISLRLLSLTDEHLSPGMAGNGSVSKAFLLVLLLIGCVIILIASFNFVNLNIGLSFTRTKEIGIRKCLGAGKKQIWLQVWGESFLMVLVSMLLAIGIVILLVKKFNPQLHNSMDASLLYNPLIIEIILALILVVSFIASGYPSSVMARLKTVDILKGKISVKRPGLLRNALIVMQFVIAIVLMCCTFIIYRQFNCLRSAPLGYNTSSIISIPIKNDENGKDIISKMRTRLATQSSVVAVSGCSVNLGIGEDHRSSTSITCFGYGDKTICGQVITADYDFLKTLGIKPVSGHDFSMDYANDTSQFVIATKSYAAQFGKKSIAGFSYYADSSRPEIIIAGIIPDIQLKSVNENQRPVVIYLNKGKAMSYLWIKVNTSNTVATMSMIKNTYAAIEPGVEFNGSYANKNIDHLYEDEQNMATLFSIAAAIAIILSCMGLFGIASIVIRQRVKEIGVRKILGASVNSIITLVSKEFIKPVFIALLIAVPIAWWTMDQWLQNYSVRIHIKWWVFAIAGIVAILITACTISFQAVKAATANPVKSLRTE